MTVYVEENQPSLNAKIRVIGVGGGGGNMINHMVNEGLIEEIDLIVANTDAQALKSSKAPIKIQLGSKKTKGLGAGMKPEVGKEAAVESQDDIKKVLEGSDMVFVATGLGGGTGTGASPVIAKCARDIGSLTIGIATLPFAIEMNKRMKLAKEGLEELKEACDTIIVIQNDKLLSIVDKNLGIKESFKIVDDVLTRAVKGMSYIILSHGESDINLDFADVKTVMSHRGLALMSIGESIGSNSGANIASDALKNAIASPLYEDVSINGAMGILVHFYIHPTYPLAEIMVAMKIIQESVDEDADVFFGTTTDQNVDPNSVRVTIIATGFEEKKVLKEDLKPLENLSSQNSNRVEEKASPTKRVHQIKLDESEDFLDVPTYLRNKT